MNAFATHPVTAEPSITCWQRLLGIPRDASLKLPLQRQIRDPLWFLARQWQVGEFEGADAGSPIRATYGIRCRKLLQFIPNQGTAIPSTPPTTATLASMPPTELLAEQEAVALGMRFRFQLGSYFERWVSTLSPAPPDTTIDDARRQYPITRDVLTIEDTGSDQFFNLVGSGAATDGMKLVDDLLAFLTEAPNSVPTSLV